LFAPRRRAIGHAADRAGAGADRRSCSKPNGRRRPRADASAEQPADDRAPDRIAGSYWLLA